MVVAAFNQEKALVGAFSVIVQPVVEPMDRFAALPSSLCFGNISSQQLYPEKDQIRGAPFYLIIVLTLLTTWL